MLFRPKGTSRAVLSALALVLLIGGAWFLFKDGIGGIKPTGLSGSDTYTGAPLTGSYKNEAFRFSIALPEGFSAGELPADEQGGTAIVLQNEKGEGIQIYIVPAGVDDKVLTEEDLRSAIPDMQIRQAEVIEIGSEHKGVAFLSDNEAYGGDSREVWFYFRGNLYQISTYAQLDSLLKAMFATWSFY